MENFFIKSNCETDMDYGCLPESRPIQEHIHKGIINLDKTSGPTSHEIDSWVRLILNAKKTGHGGTLDPKVTGILPIGINRATKVMQLLLNAGKEYVCLMRLHQKLDEISIRDIFQEFQGKIYQTPPLKSAVKRELRVRTIYYSNILELNDQYVLFKIGCEGGTYVRTYCHDIGEALGCGAHMAELRRTRVGNSFMEDETLVTLQDLTDAYYYYIHDNDETQLRHCIQPMEKATMHLPKVFIRDSAVDALCHGADLAAGGIVKLTSNIKKGDLVAIMTLKGELVSSGISLYDADIIHSADSGIMFDSQKVFMETGIYPKLWK